MGEKNWEVIAHGILFSYAVMIESSNLGLAFLSSNSDRDVVVP